MQSKQAHEMLRYGEHYLDRRSFLREIGEIACLYACFPSLSINAA
jgi:hypothetical protein